MREFHKPVHRPGEFLEALVGSGDPSESFAEDSAAALLHRVHESADPALAERIVAYAEEHGIDDVAELWANSSADSLPGALWRVYLIRHVVASDVDRAGRQFRAGLERVDDEPVPAGDAPLPDEVLALANDILRGAFTGDFAVALERAAAFGRVQAAGAVALGGADEERAAKAYAEFAGDLLRAARQWRAGSLA